MEQLIGKVKKKKKKEPGRTQRQRGREGTEGRQSLEDGSNSASYNNELNSETERMSANFWWMSALGGVPEQICAAATWFQFCQRMYSSLILRDAHCVHNY